MTNPANNKDKKVLPEGFMPMSSASKTLEVPEKPGYHRRWFRGEPGRIARAQRAGYTFVHPDDVELNNFDLGGDAKTSGNSDLGTRVSVISGDGADSTGQASRMYLMECPLEYYEASRAIIEDRNEAIADALKGGTTSGGDEETAGDAGNRYLDKERTSIPKLFTKKR